MLVFLCQFGLQNKFFIHVDCIPLHLWPTGSPAVWFGTGDCLMLNNCLATSSPSFYLFWLVSWGLQNGTYFYHPLCAINVLESVYFVNSVFELVKEISFLCVSHSIRLCYYLLTSFALSTWQFAVWLCSRYQRSVIDLKPLPRTVLPPDQYNGSIICFLGLVPSLKISSKIRQDIPGSGKDFRNLIPIFYPEPDCHKNLSSVLEPFSPTFVKLLQNPIIACGDILFARNDHMQTHTFIRVHNNYVWRSVYSFFLIR